MRSRNPCYVQRLQGHSGWWPTGHTCARPCELSNRAMKELAPQLGAVFRRLGHAYVTTTHSPWFR